VGAQQFAGHRTLTGDFLALEIGPLVNTDHNARFLIFGFRWSLSESNKRNCDMPAVDPERHIVVTDDAGREISRIPVYSKPSAEHPAW
jgi:hypothetical protein